MYIRDIIGQLAGAMPQSIAVTPEEREAIERVSCVLFTALLDLELLSVILPIYLYLLYRLHLVWIFLW